MKPSVRRFFHAFSAAAAIAAAAGAVAWLAFEMRPRGGRDAGSPAAAGGTAPSESRETASGGDSGPPLAALGMVLEASRPSEEGSLAKRFRLAGTILGASTGGAGEPMAVIDDRETVRQCVVVRSMEVVPGVVLSAVGQDFAVLSGPNGEETLRLGEKGAARGSGPASRPGVADAPRGGTAPALSSREEAAAKFGGMEVFPDRWRFDREKVIAYYEELRSEPERLLAVFDSMDPVYVQDDLTGERRIEGYEVGVEGENDFFLAAGLKDGDIVRRVNSLDMTRRDYAEALIAAFVEGRASMFVFEIERAGETQKVVFEIE